MAIDVGSFQALPNGKEMLKSMTQVGGATPDKARLFSFLGLNVGGTVAGNTGATAEQYFNDLQKNFRRISEDSVVAINGMEGNHSIMTQGLSNQAAGKPFTKAAVEGAYNTQIAKIKDQEKWLASIEEAMHLSAHEPIQAAMNAQETIIKQMDALQSGVVKNGTTVAIEQFDASGKKIANYMVDGIEAGNAKLFKVVEDAAGKKNLVMTLADVSKESATLKPIVVAELKAGAGAAAVAVDKGIAEAGTKVAEITQHLTEAPQKFINGVIGDVEVVRGKLAGMKTQVDEVGTKLLKKKAVFAAPALEKAAVTVAEGMGAEVGKLETIISEKSKSLGVVGEQMMSGEGEKALGFFGRQLANIKANFNISEVVKDGNKINAVERGALGKGMVAAGAGAGAILVGYGLKDLGKAVGMVGPDVDESGKEIPADSSTLIKSVAELGTGAALAYFTLLKGGKAAGHVL